jgi:hypothetical protein
MNRITYPRKANIILKYARFMGIIQGRYLLIDKDTNIPKLSIVNIFKSILVVIQNLLILKEEPKYT